MDKVQEAFEKEFHFLPLEQHPSLEPSYKVLLTNTAWTAYKAGVESMQEENKRLREAFKIRRDLRVCPDCGGYIGDGFDHKEECPHFKTEQALNGKEGET